MQPLPDDAALFVAVLTIVRVPKSDPAHTALACRCTHFGDTVDSSNLAGIPVGQRFELPEPPMLRFIPILLFVATLPVTGCVTTSNVVPMGKDTYMISSTSGRAFPERARIYAVKRANSFCDARKLQMEPVSENSSTSILSQAEFVFRCLNENDADYRRPDWHKDSGIVLIEKR